MCNICFFGKFRGFRLATGKLSDNFTGILAWIEILILKGAKNSSKSSSLFYSSENWVNSVNICSKLSMKYFNFT